MTIDGRSDELVDLVLRCRAQFEAVSLSLGRLQCPRNNSILNERFPIDITTHVVVVRLRNMVICQSTKQCPERKSLVSDGILFDRDLYIKGTIPVGVAYSGKTLTKTTRACEQIYDGNGHLLAEGKF
ncbi:hypothetical protein WK57_00040 [Burkholderia ubonensis]|uniref:Uncharacterized protein n=1 Tax=Burkholderia ubonensis TaxID=101571 RepID=A0A103RSS3_9BURK|nr:hypothetical protein WJ32_00040 [Burkholderia ubonensis]KVG73182.1 hypothetical protein WJ33_16515 [Burkholderia ubonensis]KWZ59121.1 hypothetical protein WK57_00040 [Burkholderia ubonensis]